MRIVCSRDVAIPMSAVALGVAVLSALPVIVSPVVALLAIAALFCTVPVMVRWARRSVSPPIEGLPALDQEPAAADISVGAGIRTRMLNRAFHVRNEEAEDAADLARMEGDAG